MSDGARFKVLMTPLVKAGVYGSTVDVTQDVDVSDWVADGGLGDIRREFDEGDYQAASLFTFGSVKLKGLNRSGKWSTPDNARSIFPYSRDLAKAAVYYVAPDATETLLFQGLLNEEGVREDVQAERVSIPLLGLESILRKTAILSGTIAAGSTFSAAIKTILSRPAVTAVLTYSASNVTVDLDLAIDDTSALEGGNAWDALKELLTASNSVLEVDTTGTVYVTTRAHRGGTAAGFFGPNDIYGRENILKISNYSTGLHRAFNTITVNGQTATNSDLVTTFGARSAKYTLDSITDTSKSLAIAQNLVDEFAAPKIEMELETTRAAAAGLRLRSLVYVDYGPELRPPAGQDKLSVWGQFTWGSGYWGVPLGAFRIDPKKAFKITGITESGSRSTVKLKLRQIGTTLSDGTLSATGGALWGGFTWGDGTLWGA